MSRLLRITSLLRRLQLLLHSSSWTQARCNKEFWLGTNRHFLMLCVGRLVFFAYVSAGFAIEMDVYAKFKLSRC